MAGHGSPALHAASVRWLATGLILHLDGLRPETFRRSMVGATAALLAGRWGLCRERRRPSPFGAFL